MIVTGGKIYETCEACGKLVRINKPIFGSLHCCSGRSEYYESDPEGRVERRRARARLRRALWNIGLPPGVDDDEFTCFEECGIRLGSWSLCYGELGAGRENGVFLCHDTEGEHELCEGLPRAGRISKLLRAVIDREDLWNDLRKEK